MSPRVGALDYCQLRPFKKHERKRERERERENPQFGGTYRPSKQLRRRHLELTRKATFNSFLRSRQPSIPILQPPRPKIFHLHSPSPTSSSSYSSSIFPSPTSSSAAASYCFPSIPSSPFLYSSLSATPSSSSYACWLEPRFFSSPFTFGCDAFSRVPRAAALRLLPPLFIDPRNSKESALGHRDAAQLAKQR